jgi:hypothetical protein
MNRKQGRQLVALLFVFSILQASIFILESSAASISLPRTGASTCYNTSGAVIDCANSGRDGDKRAGEPWPNPRFTDNLNGTVSDNLTGLVWLKNATCNKQLLWNTALGWSKTLASGQCNLSDGSVAGDWRLPNINELSSLVDLSQKQPALPSGHPFTNVINYSSFPDPDFLRLDSYVDYRGIIHFTPVYRYYQQFVSWYWSSTTFVSEGYNANYAWAFDVRNGRTESGFNKGDKWGYTDMFSTAGLKFFAWPVRNTKR